MRHLQLTVCLDGTMETQFAKKKRKLDFQR